MIDLRTAAFRPLEHGFLSGVVSVICIKYSKYSPNPLEGVRCHSTILVGKGSDEPFLMLNLPKLGQALNNKCGTLCHEIKVQ